MGMQPGTVLILLAGRFRGKRVVYLKQLSSGLLLVSGPYTINGVPLRRVNQSYCIATSTVVPGVNDVSAVQDIDDDFFSRSNDVESEDNVVVVNDTRRAKQQQVDSALQSAISNVDQLQAYLSSKFSLKNGDRPHTMKF